MDSEHFRARVARLLRRSRQAYRLYSSVGRLPRDEQGEFAEAQSGEWKQANARLSRELSEIIEVQSASRGIRGLASGIAGLRDRFLSEYRFSEAELHSAQREAINCAERSEFVKLAALAKRLVPLKSRVEALQAAYSELDELLTHGLPSGASLMQAYAGEPDEKFPYAGDPFSSSQPNVGSNPACADDLPEGMAKSNLGSGAEVSSNFNQSESPASKPGHDGADDPVERPVLAPVIPLRRSRF